jgi:hypothetical protein
LFDKKDVERKFTNKCFDISGLMIGSFEKIDNITEHNIVIMAF